MSASSVSSAYSNTIWSSVPSSSSSGRWVSQPDGSESYTVSATPPPDQLSTSSLTLTLNPTMIDSSLLSIRFRDDVSNHNITTEQSEGTELDVLSIDSSLSFGSISSCSQSVSPGHSPHLFTNIGRSLMQLSANDNDSVGGYCDSSCASSQIVSSQYDEKDFVCSSTSGVRPWWTRFQTEEDWESFARSAAQYLSTLISAEIKEMEKHEIEIDRDPWRMKESSKKSVVRYGCQRDSYSIAKLWLQNLYEAVTASILGTRRRDLQMNHAVHMKMKFISSLVDELVTVQRKLNTLPPIPPTLPNVMELTELPDETRDLLIRHCTLFDTWRAEAVEHREILETKQSICREKILSAIIEAEEEWFWSKDESQGERSPGSCNDDGYFQVVERNSPYWDDMDDVYIPQRNCHMGLRFLVTLAAGAAGIAGILLQTKRR
ncbi:hypothetical protein HJC23_009836 [Cyclotella cryptica]|uniref:Uncharacterized protein n=1 Tax=Cyclotella cryptica TaxID=29204 RepID=A0ABD3NU38_9STRA|eukprot:CCRYP_019935-RA/>CCRYP_019935-RA protein AED:0.39 eAED:0.39 QI:200/1/1/1/0/0/2/276/431